MKQNNDSFNSDDKREIDKLDKRKIGSIISENRKTKGFTQSELAEKLNISFQAVSNWECGNTLPDLSNILELSKLFGISIDTLLCNEPSGNEHVQGDDTLSKYDIDALELLNATTDFDTSKIGNMVRLMPFVSKDTINKIIVELSRKNVPANKLAVLAPFADSSAVDEAIEYKLSQGHAPNDVYPLSIFASTKKYIPYYHANVDVDVDVNIDKDSISSEDHIDSNKQKNQMTDFDRIFTLSELLDGDVPEDIIYDWLECHRTVGHIIEIYSLDIPCVCDYVQDFVLDNPEYYSVDDLIELYDNGIIDDMLEIVSDKKLSIDDLHKLKCYLDEDDILELSDNNI